jgi:hypothetical protein
VPLGYNPSVSFLLSSELSDYVDNFIQSSPSWWDY